MSSCKALLLADVPLISKWISGAIELAGIWVETETSRCLELNRTKHRVCGSLCRSGPCLVEWYSCATCSSALVAVGRARRVVTRFELR